jgi:Flp pilus assembly protein TadG
MLRRWLSVERGHSLVEFAMVAPLLLVVVFAIVDFGRIFQSQVTLTNAARKGAWLGATGATAAAIRTRVILISNEAAQ